MAGAGHRVPRDGLVAVLSVAPEKSKPGSSWLGSPAVRLRRVVNDADLERTYRPRPGLRVARALWETCRVIPVFVTCAIALAVLFCLAWLIETWDLAVAILASGVVLLLAGAIAAAITTLAKWLFVGPIRAGEHPLWSSFVWRTEVSDTFTEMVAAPWFANAAAGTPALAMWLRSLGAKVGRGVWTDSYWLPEPDLVTLGDGATVNRGCVVQTHLFHDRVMSIDTVTIEAGATLGPHSVILPAANIGANATVGPASLVMRGEIGAGGQSVERQSDRTLARGEGAGVPVCRRMSADAYTPQSGDPGIRVDHYDLTLDYKVSTNRLSGTAVIRGRSLIATRTLSFDLIGLRATQGQS